MKPQWLGERGGAVPSEGSCQSHDRGWWAVRLLWLGAVGSMVGMMVFTPAGCDDIDYLNMLRHYTPYVSGQGAYSGPYSPLFTIPVMSVARLLPLWLTIALFGFAYFSGLLTELWVGMQFATQAERKIFRYVAPVIAFFPGLLVSDVIAAGNIAYILYGLMLAGAAWGWKRQRWIWFYLAVLVASCAKVHMLTMLAIPLLCGRRQWLRGVVTGGIGLSLYALQFRIWPQAFQAYVSTMKSMSQSRRDFGCAPVGILARILRLLGVSHDIPCIVFYAVYATALFLLLLWLSRLYREQKICFQSWAPVMLLGVVLLNPRVQSYDVAAVSLPMGILAWRWLRGDGRSGRGAVMIGVAMALLAVNVLVEINEDIVTVLPDGWKYVEMVLMLGIFAGGVAGLLKEAGVLGPVRSTSMVAESFASESEQAAFEAADA